MNREIKSIAPLWNFCGNSPGRQVYKILISLFSSNLIHRKSWKNTEKLAIWLGISPVLGVIRKCFIVQWKRPKPPWHKLNVDGSLRDGQGATGGIIRGVNGNLIIAFHQKTEADSALAAEIKAIYHGLLFAIEFQCFPLIIETDSRLALSSIYIDQCAWVSTIDILKIRRLLHHRRVVLSFTPREGNSVADGLAKMGLTSQQHFYSNLHALPRKIRSLCILDSSELASLRL